MVDFEPKKPEPTTGFLPEEEMLKAEQYQADQDEKGWDNFDPEENDIENMRAMEKARQERRLEGLIGTPEKIENLKRIKGMIDLKKIPHITFDVRGEDEDVTFFLVSKELAEISHLIKKATMPNSHDRIILTNGTTIPIPQDCQMFEDKLAEYTIKGNYLATKDAIATNEDYLDPNRAEMYLFIAENPELLKLYTKEK